MNKSAVVLLSGGMDSTTLLYQLISEGWQVWPLTVCYGQRHSREMKSAEAICRHLDLPYQPCNLEAVKPLLQGSSQTDNIAVPVGHYADPVMRVTVVPNRNMILLAVAAAMAISKGASIVAYAAHAGDHTVYPDCRPEFTQALEGALRLCHYDGGIQLYTPFIRKTKAEIVGIGLELGVPYQMTYSCYEGQERHCGKCGTCVERLEAFAANGIPDPVVYV